MRISDWSSDVCSSDLGDPARRASLSGRPAVGIDLPITDADGVPLLEQREAEGHLRVRGGTVVERYFGQRAPATDAAGWRSDERRLGKEWVSPGRSGWSTYH